MQELNEFLKKILEIIEERDRKYREEMERRDKEYREEMERRDKEYKEEIARTNREIREELRREIKRSNEEFNKKILEMREEMTKTIDGRVFFHFGNETEKFGVDKLIQYLKENGYELKFPRRIINKFSILKEREKRIGEYKKLNGRGVDEVILARKGNKNYAFLIEAKHALNNDGLFLAITKLKDGLERFFEHIKEFRDFEFIPVIVYRMSGQKDIILGGDLKKYDGMEFNEKNIAKILFEELKKFKVKQVIFISPINRFEIYKK
ncbi:MAG: hypothetical protein ABIL49_05135 [candidate division WOR-3 bacterium]